MKPIVHVAAELGLGPDDLELYGPFKAKLSSHALRRPAAGQTGNLVLVTGINPTPAGEGKTTVAIGLSQALYQQGQRAVACLREPSMGPVFGMKGGATGAGAARVLPDDEINLHFTGDFHAITAAHNLLAAAIDNHLQQGNPLGMDPRRVEWPRVLDMNDRALRQVVLGLGGKANGVPREGQFRITPASEVMAILCLARDLGELKERLGNILVGYTHAGKPVRCADLGVAGAMAALLRDAVKPNLVQTTAGSPALVHGGPFANIAHGTSTVAATRWALGAADYVVQEAGFGADLGAEKFLDIVCRSAGFWPAAAVLVATVRALKYNGGQPIPELDRENLGALQRGLPNLEKHLENLAGYFGLPVVVAVNRFPTDSDAELALVAERVRSVGARLDGPGVTVALAEVVTRGPAGGAELAQQVQAACRQGSAGPVFAYDADDPIQIKIEKVATRVYGAAGVTYTREAELAIRRAERHGFGGLPVCIAKTQYSLSDDPVRLGRPEGFTITVREVYPAAGAGFLVALTGDIMTMPGLPKSPAAERIDVSADGVITGL